MAEENTSADQTRRATLQDWEPKHFSTHPALPGAKVDPLLTGIMDTIFGKKGEKEQELQSRIKESIHKTEEIIDQEGHKQTVEHGLKVIAIPYKVGQSFVAPGTNPKHPGEQILYFHIDHNNPQASIVHFDGPNASDAVPAHLFMTHELAHVAQNRGGYKTPMSAISDSPIAYGDREHDAHAFEVRHGISHRAEYSNGYTVVNGERINGMREGPDSMPHQYWNMVLEWAQQKSSSNSQVNTDTEISSSAYTQNAANHSGNSPQTLAEALNTRMSQEDANKVLEHMARNQITERLTGPEASL